MLFGTIPFTSLFRFKKNSLLTPTKFDSRKCLYFFAVFLFSFFLLYSFQQPDLSNLLLRNFESVWLSFTDKVTTGTYNFVSFLVKIILLELAPSLSLLPTSATGKTQCFFHLSFDSTLQLMNDISGDCQKLHRYFDSTAIVTFLKIPLVWFGAGCVIVGPSKLVLYLKDFKFSLFSISLLKLVVWSLQ